MYKAKSIPNVKIGIGLRSVHINHILKNPKEISQKVGWFEVHSENYHNLHTPTFEVLTKIRKDFQISLHAIGNSLGSASGLDLKHLQKLKDLIKEIDPFLVSDHISWGKVQNAHLNDLLPLPYTKKSLQVIYQNVCKMQDFLGREILVENPSTYLSFKNPEMMEFEFINELCKKSGCKLLLDVNNVFVSAHNNEGFDAKEYLNKLNKKIVREIHLAGHFESKIKTDLGKKIFIDTHDALVKKEVWDLYKLAIKNFGQVPSLIEWDQEIPEFKVLLSEGKKAEKIMASCK